MNKNRKPKKSIIKQIGVVVLALYACFILVDMQVDIQKSGQKLELLQHKKEEQRILNRDMQRKLLTGHDDEYEHIARENFGYVGSRDRVFIDRSGS